MPTPKTFGDGGSDTGLGDGSGTNANPPEQPSKEMNDLSPARTTAEGGAKPTKSGLKDTGKGV